MTWRHRDEHHWTKLGSGPPSPSDRLKSTLAVIVAAIALVGLFGAFLWAIVHFGTDL